MKRSFLILIAAAAAVAQTSRYPGALDTDSSLFVVADNVQTTLTVAMSTGDTTTTVANGAGFVPNMIVTICDTTTNTGKCTAWEHMLVTAVAGNVLTLTRGFAGTSPRTHSSGRLISALIDSAHQKVLKDAVIALQTALGPNLRNVSGGTASYDFAAYSCNVSAACSPGGPSGLTLNTGNNTLVMTPVPAGVNGTDTNHYLYISGGTGTAEPCLITGGSGTAGAASGQVIVNCANAHSGGWTVRSATAGLQEAAQSLGANAVIDAGNTQATIYAPTTISSANVTLRCAGCLFTGTPPNGSAHLTIAANNVTIDGMAFHNPDSVPGHAYDLIRLSANVNNATVQNCKLTGFPTANGVQSNAMGVSGLRVTQNLFDGLAFGVLLNNSGTDIYDVDVGDNRMVNISGDGVELNVYQPGAYVAARNIRIHDNYISVSAGNPADTSAGFCIGISGPAKVTVSGNNLHNCRVQGIHVESGTAQTQGSLDVAIVGNQIDMTGTGAGALNDGIWAINCVYCTITGNVISGAANDGIELAFDGTEQSMAVAVTGNTIRQNGGAGIRAAAASNRGDARWNIAHNVITGNAGDGIILGGSAVNINVTDNTIQGNTGYAARFENTLAGMTWRDNDISGNTAGDINIVSPAGPLLLQNGKVYFTANVPAGGNSAYTNTFNLGNAARGWLTVRVFNTAAAPTSFVSTTYDLTWNGTTLCAAGICPTIGSVVSGATLSAISYQMSGTVLQVRISNVSGSAVTGAFDVQFHGSIMR